MLMDLFDRNDEHNMMLDACCRCAPYVDVLDIMSVAEAYGKLDAQKSELYFGRGDVWELNFAYMILARETTKMLLRAKGCKQHDYTAYFDYMLHNIDQMMDDWMEAWKE